MSDDPSGGVRAAHATSIWSAILSIPFAVMAAPLLGRDSAAFYFAGASLLFVAYSCFTMLRT